MPSMSSVMYRFQLNCKTGFHQDTSAFHLIDIFTNARAVLQGDIKQCYERQWHKIEYIAIQH